MERRWKVSNIENILQNFNICFTDSNSLLTKYVLQLEDNDTLEVIVFKSDGREIRFIHDNFPAQRRIFSTNIPYTSLEDFESDLKRMKINARKELKP